ncbi:hypothetical protein [Winogradskyella rapida]|uniref:Lipoprotein n=1 Tax=Winogradskyella rapida TaxID=549701 RepID=A0ABW3KRW5_9FLAO
MKLKIILILCLIGLTSCEVSSVDTDDPNYVFDGRGGIKCKANGELLTSDYSFGGTGYSEELQFVPWNNENYMSIYFRDKGHSPDYISQWINIEIVDVIPETVQVGNIYSLESELDSNSGKYRINSPDYNYSTDDQNTGELKILYHDLENRILGGTFEYDAIDENGVIVEIREGEFDMKY